MSHMQISRWAHCQSQVAFFFLEVYTTDEAVPFKYPMQVGGGGGKVGDLVITWEPLPLRDQNGEGIEYIVYWKKKFLIDEEWANSKVRNYITFKINKAYPYIVLYLSP